MSDEQNMRGADDVKDTDNVASLAEFKHTDPARYLSALKTLDQLLLSLNRHLTAIARTLHERPPPATDESASRTK